MARPAPRPSLREVLVIDDNAPTLALCKVLLERHGCRVRCEQGGPSTETSLRDGRYDVALLDLLLPGIDGFDLLERLAAERPDLAARVVVVSGATPQLLSRLDRERIGGVVRKPFDIDELVQKVSEIGDTSASHGWKSSIMVGTGEAQ